jgi:CO/xanthine dehydrogenase Mo-binding subunit
MSTELSRRRFLKASGVLLVAFTLPVELEAERLLRTASSVNGMADRLQNSAGDPPPDDVESWLAVASDGTITLFSGKVELGTGVRTALAQIVAEELDVPVDRISVVQGETGRCPNQGSTTGSRTLQSGGVQVRRAAAQARHVLLELASARLGTPAERLVVKDGMVRTSNAAGRSVSYAALIGHGRFHHTIDPSIATKRPERYTVVGQPVARVELPAIVTGTHQYVHNVRLPGMLHGRMLHPPAIGATLERVDDASIAAIPGRARVIRRGNLLGVVAEREEHAIAAARALRATWTPPTESLPPQRDLYGTMRAGASRERVLVDEGDAAAQLERAGTSLRATYEIPYQSHGSIGPSCAVADVRDGQATIWSGTQGSYALRTALARLLQLAPERVRVVWVEASGCYGHNGADDAAADAAVLSQAVGRPVRVQWSRADELGWDPKGPAMLADVRGALDAHGRVSAWNYVVTTPGHSTRPGRTEGNLLAAQLMGTPFHMGTIGGDRNARHSYAFPHDRVAVRWLEQSVLRPSAMRGLGAPANVFANESFMDELAAAAHADPVQFRLHHLEDPRAIAVLTRVAQLARWQSRPSPLGGDAHAARDGIAIGRGVAFAQYENRYTYVATVAEVHVDRGTGVVRVSHAWVAHDCGLIVNPDGLRNQIEGATIQTISRALKEEVHWDARAVTSVDWRSYPILTFPEVPDAIDIALIDHPEAPAWGAGEASACTVPAAVANAIFDATGVRLRTLPFTPARVKAALT